ncbi:LysR family transcriptional regulator [Salipiger sp. IMCC34102]|uniref:LysR family transcriptional regulator n=1 Tax=Salipiger sp. IMCC34102 TaxID=2510647 RepID=UPI00101B8BBD|nr:LysR family transcriptional regulator [Salipiger sp. IMCC34102]RYH04481.1 LysR family transcriptional regulator [Salipiger sp. IMCC34102]
MRPDLQISQLKTLIAIDQHGSFTAAASKLGRSQSAITQQMQALEEAVGRPIFMTVGRTRQFTDAGRALLVHAQEIIAMCSHAVAAAERSHGTGIVRLGAPLEIANAILPGIMREYARIWPSSRIVLTIDRSRRLMELLEDGGLDLSLSTWRMGSREGTLLKLLRVHWIAAKDWVLPRNEPLPLVLTDEPSMFRRIGLNALDLAGMPHYERLTTHSPAGVRFAVEAGLGITPRTLSAFRADVQILGPEVGLPSLPRVSYYLHRAITPGSRQVDDLHEIMGNHELTGRDPATD